jgi:hypothetical protein
MTAITKISGTPKRSNRRRIKSPSLLTLFPNFRPTRFRTDAGKKRDTFISELQAEYVQRGLVLYVGAGVSLSLGLPSWSELMRSLSVTMMSRKVETAIDTLEKLTDEEKWEFLAKLGIQVEKSADSDKPILMMARAIKDDVGERLSSAIARVLYRPLRRRLRLYYEEPSARQGKGNRLRFSGSEREFVRRRHFTRLSSCCGPR